jgi:hypothetical protein
LQKESEEINEMEETIEELEESLEKPQNESSGELSEESKLESLEENGLSDEESSGLEVNLETGDDTLTNREMVDNEAPIEKTDSPVQEIINQETDPKNSNSPMDNASPAMSQMSNENSSEEFFTDDDLDLAPETVKAPSPPKIEDKLIPYQSYESTTLQSSEDLYKSPTPVVSTVVSEIVSIEGPIHYEEVIRRIREGCGLRRAGNKVRNIISSAVDMAENNGNIRRSGDFLLLNDTSRISVRERIYKPDITFISAEEIEEAIKMVLDFESETLEKELVIKTSRLFGFKNTSKKTFDRIHQVLEDMLNKGVLRDSNGKIDLNK